MTTQERFAKDWKMPIDAVLAMVRLGRLAGKANEHACNGDPFHAHPTGLNKADNSELWEDDVDRYAGCLFDVVKPYGFTVVFTGLYPTLKRGNDFVEIPY